MISEPYGGSGPAAGFMDVPELMQLSRHALVTVEGVDISARLMNVGTVTNFGPKRPVA